ncbi:MAG: hypothetical protein AB8D78_14330 [Akkermansiaceae bacterium]
MPVISSPIIAIAPALRLLTKKLEVSNRDFQVCFEAGGQPAPSSPEGSFNPSTLTDHSALIPSN